MRAFVIILLLAANGCAHRELLSSKQAEATSQVQHWVPVGTTVAEARRNMEQHGFICAAFTNGASSFDCDYRKSEGFWKMTATCAKASFQVTDEKISGVLVSTHVESP